MNSITLNDIDSSNPLCANCDGQGWVCEKHPEVPWGEGDGCCGGAGIPCVCNDLYQENATEDKEKPLGSESQRL